LHSAAHHVRRVTIVVACVLAVLGVGLPPAAAAYPPDRLVLQGWQQTDGQVIDRPAIASATLDTFSLFFTTPDGSVRGRSWSKSQGFGPPFSLGGYTASGPAAADGGNGRLWVYVTGGDRAVWRSLCSPGTGAASPSSCGPWQSLGGLATGSPAAIDREGGGAQSVWVRGADDHLWVNRISTSTWQPTGWQPAGGTLTSSPGADTLDDVVVRGTDGAMWLHENVPTPWYFIGGQVIGAPVSVLNGFLPKRDDFFYLARGTDNGLWFMSRSGGTLYPWQKAPGVLSGSPAASFVKTNPAGQHPGGFVEIAVRGQDGNLWTTSAKCVCAQ
jgi:hypothetical protein